MIVAYKKPENRLMRKSLFRMISYILREVSNSSLLYFREEVVIETVASTINNYEEEEKEVVVEALELVARLLKHIR
jgi:predicted nucleic-acid-binding protein